MKSRERIEKALSRLRAQVKGARERAVTSLVATYTRRLRGIAVESKAARYIRTHRSYRVFARALADLSGKLVAGERTAARAFLRDYWRELARQFPGLVERDRPTKAMEAEAHACLLDGSTPGERFEFRARRLLNRCRRALIDARRMGAGEGAQLRYVERESKRAFANYLDACQRDYRDCFEVARNGARLWAIMGRLAA